MVFLKRHGEPFSAPYNKGNHSANNIPKKFISLKENFHNYGFIYTAVPNLPKEYPKASRQKQL